MIVFSRNMYFRRCAARTALVTAVLAACPAAVHAQSEDALAEQSVPAPPYALFQNSTITSSGNSITAVRVPVVLAGKTIYENVTLTFEADASGNLTLMPGYPKVIPSPIVMTAGFKAGRYVGPSNVFGGTAIIRISGPGITTGGATEWSLAAAAGAAGYTYPCSATWYVGPATSNPLYSRLKAAGITSTAWSYGVIGSSGCAVDSSDWYPRSLVGLSQTGNTLTIVSFTSGGSDSSTPRDQITYTYTLP
jgi:hypothetical protein